MITQLNAMIMQFEHGDPSFVHHDHERSIVGRVADRLWLNLSCAGKIVIGRDNRFQ
jgi:hypothetical protein